MRRIALMIAIMMLLTLPVSAFSGISSAQSQSTVSSDGSCQVTLTLALDLQTVGVSMVFPLPADAQDITLNGTAVTGAYERSRRNVDLSGIISAPGSYTLVIAYSLPDIILVDSNGGLTLTLELLSGCEYPINSLSFTVTLPDQVESTPVFTSTYYADAIDTMMTLSQQGNVITGSMDQRLQDHETLTMTLAVTEELFPQPASKQWSMDTIDLVMIAIAFVAIVYWALTMRCLPPGRLRRTAPPEGISAGELGCRLTGQGADFTLMVISWAQMGYILIQPDDNGRVLLHKRMGMGNERSDFENRAFRSLFGRRRSVDGTGYHYAQLCRKVSRSVAGHQNTFLPSSGSPMIFRILCCAIGACSGISLTTAFTADAGWRTVLYIVLGILGAAAAWLMQSAARSLHSRDKSPLLLALAAALIWLFISWTGGEMNVSLFVIPAQFLAGFAAAYGGRRTDSGKQVSAEILGLRHYMKTIPTDEIKRILKSNPNYFYDLAPYAIALGVDRAFARQLRRTRLVECSWLTTGMDGHLTAQEWNQLLRDTVASLDALQKRLPLDRMLGK